MLTEKKKYKQCSLVKSLKVYMLYKKRLRKSINNSRKI